MSIKSQLSSDLTHAMREKDKKKLNALRFISAAIKQVEVDERIDVDDLRAIIIFDKLVKQRQESICQFKAAGRNDLVEQEEYELSLIRHYLPEPLTQDEIIVMINAALKTTQAKHISDMSKVMTVLKPQMQGRVDMSQVSLIIKERLNSINI